MRRVLVLNGPNLNMLGARDPALYGTATLADIAALCHDAAGPLGLAVDFRQTNAEHEMLAWIHAARGAFDAIVINPAAWTHTSVALRDALEMFDGPIVEVHLSDPRAREAFRHVSYVEPIAAATFAGHGADSYVRALEFLAARQD